jgi:predicted AlkP superfamily pyrophosphatase or phosphodiesterase
MSLKTKLATALFLFLSVLLVRAQNPKLIVWITVDQMRYEMLHRFKYRWTPQGMLRILNQGFVFHNAQYNYIPTYTGPGHASLFTGTSPNVHGIIANSWFNRSAGKMIYCTESQQAVQSTANSALKSQSPVNLLSSTLGDELRINTHNQSKVIAVSLKDRAAILPAGRHGNAAYWLDESSAQFVSSAWYMNALPKWAISFNQDLDILGRVKKGWQTYAPLQTYSASTADDMFYEASPTGSDKAVFPYVYDKKQNPGTWIKGTPHGNSLVTDFAIQAIISEKLGFDEYCDVLSISYSSTDIIAHATGPRAVEVEDTYLRLNLELEKLFKILDEKLGASNYLLVLSADHAGGEVPAYLEANNLPAGILTDTQVLIHLRKLLQHQFSDSLLVQTVCNNQIYLNRNRINEAVFGNLILHKIQDALYALDGIAQVYTAEAIQTQAFAEASMAQKIQNGFMPQRSGDLVYTLKPQWMDHDVRGTTHGSGYIYDTHVPLLFVGFGIKKGASYQAVSITQIAPTLSELLKITRPSGCSEKPLSEILENP